MPNSLGSTNRTDTMDTTSLSPAAQEALEFLRQNLRVSLDTKESMGDCYSRTPTTEVKLTVKISLGGELIDSADAWITIPRE